MERFACAFCGTEHIVKRGGGVISLAPVVEGLKKVEIGVDRTASELAINRLKQEISELEGNIDLIRNDTYSNPKLRLIAIIMVFIGGLLTLVLWANASTNITDGPACITLGPPVLIVGIVILVIIFLGGIGFEKKKQIELEPLYQQWRQKQEELKYHQDLVNRMPFH
jgi:hypothetical protein